MKVDRNGLTNVTVAELASLELKETETGPIWITFRSAAGKKYKVGHWVQRSDQSAIRLISDDKDRDDFEQVAKAMKEAMSVASRKAITDRGSDFCQDLHFVVLPSLRYFNQWVAERTDAFYSKSFTDVTIERVYVRIPLVLILEKGGTLIVSSDLVQLKPKNDTTLIVRTAFEEMELGEEGSIVVRSDDERWKKLIVLLLGARFSPQRVLIEVAAS